MDADLTVIMVTYQSAGLVDPSLRAAVAAATDAGLRVEVVVVDNASSDASPDAAARVAPQAAIVRNARNVGFGVACNQAFEIATGRWWLLLNPDAAIDAGALKTLVDVLERQPGVAAAAPRLEGGQGAGAESAGMHPSVRAALGHFLLLNRFVPRGHRGSLAGFQLRAQPPGPSRPVDWASAAVLLLRPAAVLGVGGFDAGIFMYGEDIDLCRRLRAAGWEIHLVPSASATHAITGGSSVSTAWIDGIDRAMRPAAGRAGRAVTLGVAAAGLALRSARPAVGSERHRRRMRASARRALGLALRALAGG